MKWDAVRGAVNITIEGAAIVWLFDVQFPIGIHIKEEVVVGEFGVVYTGKRGEKNP